MLGRYQDLLFRKAQEHGVKFDASALSQKFVPYFNSRERIKVRVGSSIYHGTVGVTTGWAPCFLLITRSTNIGSSITLDDCDDILAVQRNGKYVPLLRVKDYEPPEVQ